MEIWIPVVGYEGLYEVSDLGRVRSLDRVVVTHNRFGNLAPRHYKGRILRQNTSPATKGYPHVGLCRNGISVNYPVHILVLTAHIGPRPAGMESLHGPGGRGDARKANLSWGTRSQNIGDRVRDGQDNRGERHSLAKLTWNKVRDIRRRVALGEAQSDLADEYGVCKQTVCLVVHNKTWIETAQTY